MTSSKQNINIAYGKPRGTQTGKRRMDPLSTLATGEAEEE
jgi:hypothetical protein